MVPHELVTVPSLPHADGHSMWASVQKEPPPQEPNYSSIEQLFCLPVTEHKDKGAAAPVKKEPKEVRLVNTRHGSSELQPSEQTHLIIKAEYSMCCSFFFFFFFLNIDYFH